jgi:hypothetical protein
MFGHGHTSSRTVPKFLAFLPPAPAVYAALVAVVNTKFPELGELLLHRVVTQVGAGSCIAVKCCSWRDWLECNHGLQKKM